MTLLVFMACSPPAVSPNQEPAVEDSTVVWEELSEEDLERDDKDDTGKESACGPEVLHGEDCEGDWTTTTCLDEAGEYWWCEDGVWTTGK